MRLNDEKIPFTVIQKTARQLRVIVDEELAKLNGTSSPIRIVLSTDVRNVTLREAALHLRSTLIVDLLGPRSLFDSLDVEFTDKDVALVLTPCDPIEVEKKEALRSMTNFVVRTGHAPNLSGRWEIRNLRKIEDQWVGDLVEWKEKLFTGMCSTFSDPDDHRDVTVFGMICLGGDGLPIIIANEREQKEH